MIPLFCFAYKRKILRVTHFLILIIISSILKVSDTRMFSMTRGIWGLQDSTFWDVRPRSLKNVYGSFGETLENF
jgi:hypothetical protein